MHAWASLGLELGEEGCRGEEESEGKDGGRLAVAQGWAEEHRYW